MTVIPTAQPRHGFEPLGFLNDHGVGWRCVHAGRCQLVPAHECDCKIAGRRLSGLANHMGAIHRTPAGDRHRLHAATRTRSRAVCVSETTVHALDGVLWLQRLFHHGLTTYRARDGVSHYLYSSHFGYRIVGYLFARTHRHMAMERGSYFLGALIVVQPGQGELTVGVWLVLGAATCYAIYQLMTRSLFCGRPDTQIFYTAFAGCIVTSLTVGFVGMVPNNWFDIGKFIALGSLGALGHFLVIQALRRASASFMSPLGYVELLGAAALGYAVFGEVPGVDLWIGAACIVASGLIVPTAKQWLPLDGLKQSDRTSPGFTPVTHKKLKVSE